MKKTRVCLIVAAIVAPTALVADVTYDESIDGDLSNAPGSPTRLGSISEERLVVTGSVQTGSAGDTRDYFTFIVPKGHTLDGMRLVEYLDGTTGQNANTGYVLIDEGSSSVLPSIANSGLFLGGSHLNRTRFPDAAVNMFATMSTGNTGGTGFTYPLGPGSYTVNVQQTGAQQNTYVIHLDFSLPCPGDLDGDGEVNGGDLGRFLGEWGASPCDYDLNGDGDCNGADLGVILGNWGEC